MGYVQQVRIGVNERAPLKYVSGAERTLEVTIDRTTVDWGPFSHRRVVKGELLCRIAATGLYGPHEPEAEDGRQTLAAPTGGVTQAVVATEDVDCQLRDQDIDGWFANCVFDYSELVRHGATWADLANAFPTCLFDD